jgi:hypothetical protein
MTNESEFDTEAHERDDESREMRVELDLIVLSNLSIDRCSDDSLCDFITHIMKCIMNHEPTYNINT